MTEHLPECVASVVRMGYDDTYCICDELRACEERVMRAVMHTVDVDSYEEGQRDCKATHPVLAVKEITRIASKGYDTGLDAAREAVEGEWTEDPSWDGTNWNNALTCALESIDALRQKP